MPTPDALSDQNTDCGILFSGRCYCISEWKSICSPVGSVNQPDANNHCVKCDGNDGNNLSVKERLQHDQSDKRASQMPDHVLNYELSIGLR